MIKRTVIVMFVLLFSSFLIVSCSPGTPATDDVDETLSEKHGGTLRSAYYAPTNMDPAFLSTAADDFIARQWGDFLVFIGEDSEPDINRGVAEAWEVDETGKIWTFTLRQGILFHDGKEMTSRDVKVTFDRLRDPELGAATVGMYENIMDIKAVDDYTVVFELANPNADFLKDLGDYHGLVIDADNEDYSTNWNGTGPFMIERYVPEDRVVLVRNPNYWLTDDEGLPLPYLDEIEILFLSESSAQVEALLGGQIDFIIYFPTEFIPMLEEDPNVEVYQAASNTAYVLRMRSDEGPTADVLVRQALKAATDRSAILDGAFGGYGTTGRDTPIGPAYGDFYLDVPEPVRDVEKAKELLAEAGYADGLDLTIHAQESSPIPTMAIIWQEQLAEAGVNLEIQLVPSEVYYGADNMWLEVPLGITDWGSRPYPQPYLDQAYVCGATWNESHWCDPELDELAALARVELDHNERIRLYHEIQKIFIDRGPIIIPFFANNVWGATEKLKGAVPTSSYNTALDLRYVYFE